MKSHITKVYAQNLKGRSFSNTLAPLTLISGPNASGKSARLDALALASMGHHPDLPKTNQGIFQLSSAPSMTVGLAMSDGGTVERTWTGGASVKSAANVTLVGQPLDVLTFSPSEFIRASAANQAGMIISRLGAGKEGLHEQLAARMAEFPRALVLKPGTGLLFDEYAATWESAIGEHLKDVKAHISRMEKAITALVVLDEAPADSVTLQDVTDAITASTVAAAKAKAAAELHRKAQEELRGMVSRLETMPQTEERHALLAKQQAATDHLKAAEAAYAAASAAAKAFEAAQSKLKGLSIPEQVENIAELSEMLAALAPLPVADCEALNQVLEAINAEIKSKQASLADAQLGLSEASDVCACCGAAVQYWTSEKKEAVIKRRADFAAAREFLPIELVKLEKRRAVILEDIAAMKGRNEAAKLRDEERAAIMKRIDEAKQVSEMEAMRAQLMEAMPPAPTANLEALAEQVVGLETEVEAIADSMEAADKRAAQIQAIAAKLADMPVTINSANMSVREHVEGALEQLAKAAVAEEIAAAEAEKVRLAKMNSYSASSAASANASQREQAAKQIEEAQTEFSELDQAKKTLKAASAAIAARLLEPVLSAAHRFTDGLLDAPLAAKGLQIGRWHGLTWVPLATFSESEKMLCIAAIQAGLASNNTARVAIIDEANRIDENRREELVRRLYAAIKDGVLTQVIMLANTRWHDAPADAAVINI